MTLTNETFIPTDIPNWATDLAEVSGETRGFWSQEAAIRAKFRKYYSGDIFKSHIPDENSDSGELPLLYPVGMNIVKMLCLTMADSMYGEWEEDVVTFEPNQNEEFDENEKEASKILQKIMRASGWNSESWEIELERNVYGGSAVKVQVDFKKDNTGREIPDVIRWMRVPIDNFYPIWSPDDKDELLEVYIVTPITQEQAQLRWGINNSKSSEIVYQLEHWTKQKYEYYVDGIRIDAYSGGNPWGVVPFVFIPRYRLHHWWGEALTEDLMSVQDEINMRLGDLGDAVNYNTHPIRYGFNLPQKFNAKNFPLGANVFWDLGRSLNKDMNPVVGLIEAENPIPQGTFDYIKFVYDWSRVSSFAPPVALGEDSGGGQRSGVTLEIRMAPLIKSVRRSRAYMTNGLNHLAKITAIILRQKNLSGISTEALKCIFNDELTPKYATILPRDRAALVDEIVKRMSTTPPTVSIETAVKLLGGGINEVDLITTMVERLSEGGDLFVKQPVNTAFGGGTQDNIPGVDGKAGLTKGKHQSEQSKVVSK